MSSILSVSFTQAKPAIQGLLAEYLAEIKATTGRKPRWEMYETLEKLGLLYTIVVSVDGVIGGFCLVVISPELTDEDAVTATCLSYFVAKKHRLGGVGIKLLAKAEAVAKEHNAKYIIVLSQIANDIGKLLSNKGYTALETAYRKEI